MREPYELHAKKALGRVVALAWVAASAIWMAASASVSWAEVSSPWPMFGHDHGHTGRTELETAANSVAVKIKWKFVFDRSPQIRRELHAGPVIGVDDTVYVGGYEYSCKPDGNCSSANGVVDAVDSAGHLKWEHKSHGDGVGSSPAVGADGTIYLGLNDYIGSDGLWSILFSRRSVRHLYAMNPDGTLKWKFPTGSSSLDTLAIGPDGTLYGAVQCGDLFAINPDGTLKWSFNTGGVFTNGCIGDSYPAIANDGTIYAAVDSPDLIESKHSTTETNLDAIGADGRLKWKLDIGLGGGTPAISADGTIYVGNCEGNFYAVNPDGSVKWKLAMGVAVLFGIPAIGTDGTVYVGNDDVPVKNGQVMGGVSGGHFNAIGPGGRLKWRATTDRFLEAPAVSADGTIYVGSPDGTRPLYAFDPDGRLKWKLAEVGGQPAIGSDGTLYVRGHYGLYALGAIGP